MSKVIGIDLGTTNSCVAAVEDGVPTVIPNASGYKTTPSVVAVTAQGRRLVGESAKRQAVANPENTVYGIKRMMGRPFDDPVIQTAMLTVPFTIVAGPNQDVRVTLQGRNYAVPEISSIVLTELKAVAEQYLGDSVTRAVITVPAHFRENQRQATKDAARIAGLDVIRILNEPTAAALAYGYGRDMRGRVAVFDLGGGTFDISILNVEAATFEVLTSNGDTLLGGEDFDARIIDWLVQEFDDETGIDLRDDPMALHRLKEAAESAKIALSSQLEAEIALPFLHTPDGGEAMHLNRRLSRNDLEEMVEDLVLRTIAVTEQALRDAGLRTDEIDAVLLVGGQTRMPMVQNAVATFFGRPPLKGINPDEAVALGAAIQANMLTGQAERPRSGTQTSAPRKNMLLLDLTPHSLGVEVTAGLYQEVIPKDTPIPASRTRVFTTERDGQKVVKIRVLQGMRNSIPETLGELTLSDLREAPRGEVQIEVTFDIDADGTLNVKAVDIDTRRETKITLASKGYIPETEMAGMIDYNRDYLLEQEQEAIRRSLEMRVQEMVSKVNRMLPELERRMGRSAGGVEALQRIRTVVSQAEVAMATGSPEQLQLVEAPLQRIQQLVVGTA